MTLWELSACVDGVNYANNPDAKKFEPPTDKEFDDMLEAYNELTATRQ